MVAKLRFIRTFTGFSGPIVSIVLHFVVTLCYIKRWDKATAVTVFPLWFWAILGILIVTIAWFCVRNKFGILIAAVWTVTALVGADEIPGLLHTIQGKKLIKAHPQTHEGKQVLRVATINCRDRRPEALLEAKPYAPDIVFIQESPTGVELNKIAKEFYGKDGRSAGGWKCGIIARGELKLIKNSTKPRFTHATLTLPDGRSIDLVSVHLKHAITRWDLWDRDCWKTHYENRKVRRNEIVEILTHVSKTHGGRQVIFGGDFNAPASDAVYSILRHHFLDSYRAAGSGWGNTFYNRLPLLRIDQLWATPQLEPLNARAFPTRNTDHRLLVCDYKLN
ncbi:MAG: endonuclease/exonuclease/phosphatase (EEP) superfamily protein YafD [Verrucomicrobiales bacterium]|jgi:endonuclease/exonuclease/phosphatase (EEP) superfamily protein YafD